MGIRRNLLRLLAVLFAFAMVAAACGSSDDDDSSSSSSESASATAEDHGDDHSEEEEDTGGTLSHAQNEQIRPGIPHQSHLGIITKKEKSTLEVRSAEATKKVKTYFN